MRSSARFRSIKGEIYYVDFPFDDSNDTKARPALVIGLRDEDHIVAAKITHVIRGLDREILLTPNDSNGLRTPSVIRMDCIRALHRSSFTSFVGSLNEFEMTYVRQRFREFDKSGR